MARCCGMTRSSAGPRQHCWTPLQARQANQSARASLLHAHQRCQQVRSGRCCARQMLAAVAHVVEPAASPAAASTDGGTHQPTVAYAALKVVLRQSGATCHTCAAICRGGLGCITEADVLRWAAHFAAGSFGDALFASALALLLRPDMPPAVQVCPWSL